ncbi:DUF2799 domain-containing protein [uncultured Neptuniibacter sp.]|uniref:DUF2799 domain-containing protein n=1 Tax=uncultured Neptuniibacter sp. TaxID=502143 RepID=UPI00263747BF|nr:DUF2799 domain-containing protein [uncultured Neptuniibacter sp.]
MLRLLIVTGSIISLSGCASLNQSECVTGDWQGIGYRDGAQGKSETFVADHQQACAEYQIRVDLQAYLEGRGQGLQAYCQPGNGYRLGHKGAKYNPVCPKSLSAEFENAYREGRALYQLEQRVRQVENQIKRNDQQIDSLHKQIVQVERSLVSEGLTTSQRRKQLVELRDLEASLQEAGDQRISLSYDLQQAEYDLQKHLSR